MILTDSIAKGVHMYESNRFIKNDKATMFNFPGGSSHQMLHYLNVHLEGTQINTVAIHIGINDILSDSSQSNIAKHKICLKNIDTLILLKYTY